MRTRLLRSAPAMLLVLVAVACSATTPEKVGSATGAFSTESWVDGNVESFQALPSVPGLVYVLGSDGNLWREVGSMNDRTWVDGNVRTYQPMDGSVVYVLGTNGNLWREVGSMSSRTEVATGVSGFQVATDGTGYVYYLDGSAQLWLVEPGMAPLLLASAVRGYQWAPDSPGAGTWGPGLYVLHTNGSLWRASAVFTPTSEKQIDANVSSFRALDGMTYYVERNSSTYLHENDTSSQSSVVDTNVEFFWPLDDQTSFVEDLSFNLWREQFSARNRDLVDVNVKAYQPIAEDSAYVLHMDGNLWLESLAAPACTYGYAPTVCTNAQGVQKGGQNEDFVAAWGVETASGTCPDIPALAGTWKEMVNGAVPGNTVAGTPTCAAVGLPSSCCMYVWWPVNGALQDPSVLCSPNDLSVVAYDECGVGCPTGGPFCGHPGGGGCPSCTGGVR